ncbi:MAG: ribonuclease HII [Bacilli bacterium]
MNKSDLFQYENELYQQGIKYIGGVDEVGRGPLIGPVVACCCVLPKEFQLEGLTDSKKLSEKKRDIFYEYLIKHALAYDIGVVEPALIDKINIYQASKKAMEIAIAKVREKINLEHVLIDAMPITLDIETTSIIKGDAKSISIAAASVIAKVTRDKMMYSLAKKYPQYGFDTNKGYPTKKHLEALKKYGLIPGYRQSYGPVKKIVEEGKYGKI